jgi:hypothetical protein
MGGETQLQNPWTPHTLFSGRDELLLNRRVKP